MYRPGIPMNSNTRAQTDARVKPEHDEGGALPAATKQLKFAPLGTGPAMTLGGANLPAPYPG